MFLWIPGLDAWQTGVRLGFFPREILNGPARVWKAQRGAHWIDLPSLGPNFDFAKVEHPDRMEWTRGELASRLGYRLKEEAPAGPHRVLAFLWNLHGVQPSEAALKPGGNSARLLKFTSADRAIPLIREILRIENTQELRYCSEPDRFWLRIQVLSRFSALAIEQGDYPEASLFVERAPHLWLEAGSMHPLEQVIVFPSSSLTSIDANNDITVLEESRFQPLFDALQWKIEPPREWVGQNVVAEISRDPLLEIPLKLTELPQTATPSIPDLWVLTDREIPHLCRWMEWASLEVRQAFRFAVLKGDAQETDQTILLYRFREVLKSALGEIPGKPYHQAVQLAGLFLPEGTRIHPDPGPVQLRKLAGMDRLDQMAWIEKSPSDRLMPQVFASSALGGWETIVRFSLEKEQTAWRTWTQSFAFAWEMTAQLIEAAPPAASHPVATGKGSPEGQLTEEKSGKENPARLAAPLAKSRGPVRSEKTAPVTKAPVTKALGAGLFSSEVSDSHSAKTDPKNPISNQLLDDFDASPLEWGDPERIERLNQLALAWTSEGQPIWAGKAWLISAWNKGVAPWDDRAGLNMLRSWHLAEAQLRSLPAEPDLSGLAKQAAATEFRPNRLGWLLTGLILCQKNRGRSQATKLTQELYTALQTVLIEHGPNGSQRLLFHAWNQLALMQDDRLIAIRGAERQRFTLLETGLNLKEEWPGPLLGRHLGAQEPRDQLGALTRLLERTTGWLESHGQTDRSCMTLAMVRWSFAYGMARLGAADKARELASQARQKMAAGDLAPLVAEAYAYRVEQALGGKAASGPLSAEWQAKVSQLDGLKAFPLDYTREMSQILEPHQSVQPFASALGMGQEQLASMAIGAKTLPSPGSDPTTLARLCLEKAEALRLLEPRKAVSAWIDLLDRILLLPTAEARVLLNGVWEFVQDISLAAGDGLRLQVRALIAGSFFQHRPEDWLQSIFPLLEDRDQLAGWMGIAGTGPNKTLGMNKELFSFCSRRLGLLAQMEHKSWIGPILESLTMGLGKLGALPHAEHGRFLTEASRLRFLPRDHDNPLWQRLIHELSTESHHLAGTVLRRNEPWQAHVNKLVAYIQAAGARGPQWALEKLSALFEWILPLRDYFATNPALAGRNAGVDRSGVFAYERNQVEWIEAMVLALAESAEVIVSLWARRDEALIRARIVQSLDANRIESSQAVQWNRELPQ